MSRFCTSSAVKSRIENWDDMLNVFQEYIETEGLATILHKVIIIQRYGSKPWLTGAWTCPVPPSQCVAGGGQAGHVKDTEHAPSWLRGQTPFAETHMLMIHEQYSDQLPDERVHGT